MNETERTEQTMEATTGFRPKFAIYHPNTKGTGCALKMSLHPAHDDRDGSIMMTLVPQKTVGDLHGPVKRFPTFDWEHDICVKLDFNDLCKMMQVFRGECESLEDGKGLFHRSPRYATRIVLRHMLEPTAGYSLEVYRNTPGGSEEDRRAHIFLMPWEALGVALAFEHSIGVICFGIPKVVPHDVTAYRQACREARNASAA